MLVCTFPDFASRRGEARFDVRAGRGGEEGAPPLCEHNALHALKEKTGLTKAKVGERAWRTAVSYVDPYSKLPSLHRAPSRAYFKLLEIGTDMLSAPPLPISSALFLCEAPGGFVHAAHDMWRVQTAVAHSDLSKTPFPFLPRGTEVVHADLLVEAEHARLLQALAGRRFDLVTADGCVDIEHRHAQAEVANLGLFFLQSGTALASQKEGGSFVLKVFDVETTSLASLLLAVASCYATARLCKPLTSRASNGERYAVFSGFRQGAVSDAVSSELLRLGFLGDVHVQHLFPLAPEEASFFRDAHAKFTRLQCSALQKTIDVASGRIDARSPGGEDASLAFCSRYVATRNRSGPASRKEWQRERGRTAEAGGD